MPATKRLVLDLPADQVDLIEARVAEGGYGSVSEAVLEAVNSWDESKRQLDAILAPIEEDSPEFEAFLTRCAETARRVEAGLEPTYTVAEVRAHLAQRRALRDAADDRS